MQGKEIYLVLGMALVTFLLRYPVLVWISKIELPKNVSRALVYVPPVVLTAIIVPAVLFPSNNHLQVNLSHPYLAGSFIAAIVSYKTKNLLLTIFVGMLSMWFWRWLIPAL